MSMVTPASPVAPVVSAAGCSVPFQWVVLNSSFRWVLLNLAYQWTVLNNSF